MTTLDTMNFDYFQSVANFDLMGRRQAVRHWVLIPACAGSNPAGPAIPFLFNFSKR